MLTVEQMEALKEASKPLVELLDKDFRHILEGLAYIGTEEHLKD